LPSVCPFPTFIVDCPNNTVTLIEDWTANNGAGWGWAIWPKGGYWGGAVDYTTGIYYFGTEDYYTAVGGTNNGALFKIDLSSETTSLVSFNSDYYPYVIQGTSKAYLVESKIANFNLHQLRAVPTLSLIGSSWTSPSSGYRVGSWVMDECNSRLWIYYDPGSEIISRSNGGAQTLQINWGGGSTPFSCSSSQRISIVLLAGKVLFIISSYKYSPSCYQCDFYILEANIACP
jgi:hypothetical protein